MVWNSAKVREDNVVATILLRKKLDLYLKQLIAAYKKGSAKKADLAKPSRFTILKALRNTKIPISRLRTFVYDEDDYTPPLVNILQICHAVEESGGPDCSDVVATAISQLLKGKPQHWKEAVAKKLAQRSALSKTA